MKRIMILAGLVAAALAVVFLAIPRETVHAVALTVPHTLNTLHALRTPDTLVWLAVGPALMGLQLPLTAVSNDRDDYPVRGKTLFLQLNNLINDVYWYLRNHTSEASAPACAMATTTTKAKTTAAVDYVRAGIKRAQLAAQDNFWILTDAVQGVTVVPAGSAIKYLLCVTAAEAAKSYSSAVATGATPGQFAARPVDGDAVIGTLTITTDATHTFTPGTTALNAAGITATFTDGDDLSALQTTTISFT